MFVSQRAFEGGIEWAKRAWYEKLTRIVREVMENDEDGW